MIWEIQSYYVCHLASQDDEPDPNTKVMMTFEALVENERQQESYRPMPRYLSGFTWNNAAFIPQKSFSNTGLDTALQQNRKCAVFNLGCRPLTMFRTESTFIHLIIRGHMCFSG